MICQKSLDTDLVYKLVKALYEHNDYMRKIHPSAAYTTPENAVKYSEENPKVSIEVVELDKDIEISISDKGRGIAPEYQDKVFDKFFRVPQGNIHNVKGHGLGLSYVKEVVESLGGNIKLKSGLNAGSTFIIKMPKTNG